MPYVGTIFHIGFSNGISDTVCICENLGSPLHRDPYVEHERIYFNMKFLQ